MNPSPYTEKSNVATYTASIRANEPGSGWWTYVPFDKWTEPEREAFLKFYREKSESDFNANTANGVTYFDANKVQQLRNQFFTPEQLRIQEQAQRQSSQQQETPKSSEPSPSSVISTGEEPIVTTATDEPSTLDIWYEAPMQLWSNIAYSDFYDWMMGRHLDEYEEVISANLQQWTNSVDKEKLLPNLLGAERVKQLQTEQSSGTALPRRTIAPQISQIPVTERNLPSIEEVSFLPKEATTSLPPSMAPPPSHQIETTTETKSEQPKMTLAELFAIPYQERFWWAKATEAWNEQDWKEFQEYVNEYEDVNVRKLKPKDIYQWQVNTSRHILRQDSGNEWWWKKSSDWNPDIDRRGFQNYMKKIHRDEFIGVTKMKNPIFKKNRVLAVQEEKRLSKGYPPKPTTLRKPKEKMTTTQTQTTIPPPSSSTVASSTYSPPQQSVTSAVPSVLQAPVILPPSTTPLEGLPTTATPITTSTVLPPSPFSGSPGAFNLPPTVEQPISPPLSVEKLVPTPPVIEPPTQVTSVITTQPPISTTITTPSSGSLTFTGVPYTRRPARTSTISNLPSTPSPVTSTVFANPPATPTYETETIGSGSTVIPPEETFTNPPTYELASSKEVGFQTKELQEALQAIRKQIEPNQSISYTLNPRNQFIPHYNIPMYFSSTGKTA